MNLGRSISGVLEVVGAFLRREAAEKLADGSRDGVDGSGGSFAQQRLELGEDLRLDTFSLPGPGRMDYLLKAHI